MKYRLPILLMLLFAGMIDQAAGENAILQLPKHIEAGSAFSIPTAGNGKAVLFIAGPSEVLRRDVQLGNPVSFGAGELCNAGHYLAVLKGNSVNEQAQFDVVAAPQPAALKFLAKPSRLPVRRTDDISGVAYIFDSFQNLILQPMQVSFQLSEAGSDAQVRSVSSRRGVAWVSMNSAPKAGIAQFRVSAGNIIENRVVQQVPGDPCRLHMNGRQSGQRMIVETDPVRDCSGNPVPDGTIISFTESGSGATSTVDVPLKKSVARTELPLYSGAVISVASGVVLGNEIRVGDTQSR